MNKIHVSSSELFDQVVYTTCYQEEKNHKWKTTLCKWLKDADEKEYARIELPSDIAEPAICIELSRNELASLLVHLNYINQEENEKASTNNVISIPCKGEIND